MTTTIRTLFITLILLLTHVTTNGQVLISLLLGDNLNSGKMEFGLDGGLSLSELDGVSPSSARSSFHLGFYFDIRLKERWLFHTGVIVKSTMGGTDIPVYPLNDPELDDAFSDGSVKRKLGYFNIPAMLKYRWPNNFFVEGGPMFGLMTKSTDEFVATFEKKDDLSYEVKIKDRYHPLDVGIMAGIGYRLMRGNGMNLGIRYYYGLVDVEIDDSFKNQYNRTLYFAVGIPIGVGKKNADVEKN